MREKNKNRILMQLLTYIIYKGVIVKLCNSQLPITAVWEMIQSSTKQ